MRLFSRLTMADSDHHSSSRWHVKQPLHLSADPQAQDSPNATSFSNPNTSSSLISDSYTLPSPEPQQSFTTAFAMLIYDICYLAYTQSVDIPLAQAGDVLSNLWSICCSAELGKYVLAPFLPSFPPSLDVH